MTPEPRSARGPLWPHLLTASLTLLIQLVMAAYVYGRLSADVGHNHDEVNAVKARVETKLDKETYFREHPKATDGVKEVPR